MQKKLTSEELAEWLALLPTVTDIADESGIDQLRLKNLKLGRVKSLTESELDAVQAAFVSRGFFILPKRDPLVYR
jgi:hypothetical protein